MSRLFTELTLRMMASQHVAKDKVRPSSAALSALREVRFRLRVL